MPWRTSFVPTVADLRADIAIVGGGIAGLAAAHELARRGASFLLLEATPRWGGVICTEEVDGFLLEGGPDSLLAVKPDAVALCRELGLDEQLVPTSEKHSTVFVLRRGRLHPLPEGVLGFPTRLLPFLTSGLFSIGGKLRMALDLILPRGREEGDESIAAFVRRRCGREAVERLAEPLLAGIHAGDPERLSIAANFPRLLEIERRKGSLIRGLVATKTATPPGTRHPAFVTLEKGLGQLVAALVSNLPQECLRSGTLVMSLAREGEGFVLEPGGSSLVRVRARAVIIALPPRSSAPLLTAAAPEVGRRLSAIRFASSATVYLGYRRGDVAHPLNGYGIVVPQTEGLRTAACSFFSTKFPGRAPAGHVLLRGFLGGVKDPEVLSLDDQALIATFEREMSSVLGLGGRPVLARVYRWPEGTPQMEVGHQEGIARVDSLLAASCPNLFLTGAGLRGTGIPDTVADARRTAQKAREALPNPSAAE